MDQKHIIDGYLSDLLIIEWECDLYIEQQIPTNCKTELSKMMSLNKSVHIELLEWVHAPFWTDVMEALVKFKEKYNKIYDEGIHQPYKKRTKFKQSFKYKYCVCCIQVANDFIDMFNAQDSEFEKKYIKEM